MQYLMKPNGEQMSTRSFGVEASDAAYVGFLHPNCRWCKDKLDRVAPRLASPDLDVACAESDNIDGDDIVTHARVLGRHHG